MVVILFAANVAGGLAFAAITWSWLAAGLDGALPTRTLLTNLDANVFIDLWVHQRASIRMLFGQGLLLVLICAAVWVWINGATIVAVSGSGSTADCLRASLALYPRFVLLWSVTAVWQAVVVGAAVLMARLLVRWTAEVPSEMISFWIWAVCLGCAAVAVLFASAVHDHARIHCAATDTAGARSVPWAITFLVRRVPTAVVINLVFLALGALFWAVYQTAATLIPVTASIGVIVSLLWGQTLILARMMLRVWLFACEAALQASYEQSA
jgi:hypothetical protein